MKNPLSDKYLKITKILGGTALTAAAVIGFAANGRTPSKNAVVLGGVSAVSASESAENTQSAGNAENAENVENVENVDSGTSASEETSRTSSESSSESSLQAPENSLININLATSEQLQALSGIGEAKAAAIIEYREKNGGFSDVSEIMNVKGIGEKIFENLRDRITVGENAPPKQEAVSETAVSGQAPENALININLATSEQLQALSGIGEAKAAAIIEYREKNGGFSDVSEIMNVKGIGEKIFEKIRGRITV